ncbi:MAG: GNAT family N-acetyltransferase [Clostridiales bacterium]|nr:GNAT family N-acetyltransferase [Clostridiales bacterium]
MRKIQLFLQPDLPVVREARELESVCKAHDGLFGSLYLDPALNFSPDIPALLTLHEDDRLLGLITFFAPTQAEAELTGLTHPDVRRTGVFRALAAEAATQAAAFGIPELLFVCEPQVLSGVAALAAIGATLEYSEYSLRYDRSLPPERLAVPAGLSLRRAEEADLDVMAQISAACFQEPAERARQFLARALGLETRAQYLALLDGAPVAIGGVGIEADEATIYGIGVSPDMQGRGIGRGVVALLLRRLLSSSDNDVLIEVDSANAGALHLYLACGLTKESTSGYYRIRADRLASGSQFRR